MSHRMYLYNLDYTPVTTTAADAGTLPLAVYGTGNEHVQLMMEWKYELPLFFHPLFAGPTTIAPNVYNPEDGGVYAPLWPGAKAFHDLYAFIETHQHALIEDIAAFQQAKKKIFNYFRRKITHATFYLDAWDVFNMSGDPHAEQAEALLAYIQSNNNAIAAAIEADDPALLDKAPYFSEGGSYYKTFRELLNAPLYNYGWEVLSSVLNGDEEALVIFEEGSLKGLKDPDGAIVIPAIYTDIYAFPYGADLAVVTRNGKAGYIDRSGTEILPCLFDDAFDFEHDRAAVVSNGKFGIINTSGTFIISAIYEDGHILSDTYVAVQQNGQWGIIDMEGNEQLPFQDVQEITAVDDSRFTYYAITTHNGELLYYTHQFKQLTTEPVTAINCFGQYYIVTKDDHSALFDEQANMLLDYGYRQIYPEYLLNALIVESAAGKGLYAPDTGWILPCEYEQIAALRDVNSGADSALYAVVKQNKKAGLFGVSPKNQWILPVAYQDFKWLKPGILAYKENKLWGLVNGEGEMLGKASYTSINSKLGYLPYGIALGFQTEGVKVIREDGTTRQLTSTEAFKESDPFTRDWYSKKEIQQLDKVAELAQKALQLNEEGQDHNDAGNYEKAIALFQQAAELGYIGGYTNIGHIYEVVPAYADADKSFAYYTRAAEMDEPYAMSNLALCYAYGRGTPVNVPAALHWFQKAADAGHVDAFAFLGDMYYKPEFNMIDIDKALPWYTKATAYGDDQSHVIGHIYETKNDYEQAVYHYQTAVANGTTFAKWRMACLYMDGLGVKVDLAKALNLLYEAIDDWPQAHVDLAMVYLTETCYDAAKARMHLDAAKDAGVYYAEEYREKFRFLWDGIR